MLSIRNASFAYDRTRQLMDENNDEYDCVLKSVNCDIKMVIVQNTFNNIFIEIFGNSKK